MKLYVTRHGQTDWNLQQKIQGKADIALNDTGRKQAGITRDQLQDVPFDILFVSPLKRAYETAEIINEAHHVPIVKDERIIERDFGKLEGSWIKDLDFSNFWCVEEEHRFPDCEKTSLFYKRIYDFIDELKNMNAYEHVLVVAHGGVSLPFYTYFHGVPCVKDMRPFMLNNCEVTCYDL